MFKNYEVTYRGRGEIRVAGVMAVDRDAAKLYADGWPENERTINVKPCSAETMQQFENAGRAYTAQFGA